MVLGFNKAVRAVGCTNCRLALVRSFTAIAGIPLLPSSRQGSSRAPIKYNTRYTSTTTHPTLVDSTSKHDDRISPFNKEDREESTSPTAELIELPEPSSLPWYLQQDKPLINQRPLSERQKIPDLPESSPPILQPLLQQISVDLGLDDLSLLDLRGLDPPPALGANLLMIIGTARSEKHLHVSAGSLCRWLRSEHKLRPDADGLLGRNELKLKMRRKNRRAKLLGSGNADDDYDDGVRTGWVCVNVGTVEDPVGERMEVNNESFVGFGRQTEGTKVVVQMLVEEKRKELDLEKLWSGIKRRQLLGRSEGDDDGGDVALEEVQTGVSADNSSHSTSESTISHKLGSLSQFPSKTPSSSRGFHTSAREQSALQASSLCNVENSAPLVSPANISESRHHQMTQEEILLAMRSNDFDAIRALLSNFPGSSNIFRGCLVECLKQHLTNMTSEQAVEALGNGPADFVSTPFLSCLTLAAPEFPSKKEWEFRVWLYCFARKIGHEDYGFIGLKTLFEQLQLCGIAISRDMYLGIIRSALDNQSRGDRKQEASHIAPSQTARIFVADVLRDMHERGLPLLSTDVFIALHESSANLSSRLDTLIRDLDIRITEEKDLIQLLNVCAKGRRWPAFWQLWDSLPSSGLPRPAALYAVMFQRIADTQSQKYCIKVLRDWIPDMDRENPEIKLEGDVLDGVKACLTIADPNFQESSLADANAKGEWLTLWRRCYQGGQQI